MVTQRFFKLDGRYFSSIRNAASQNLTNFSDLMENRKKTKMDSESRKRISRDKMRKMKEKGDSSDSDSPATSPTKRKKPSKKTKKGEFDFWWFSSKKFFSYQ